MKIALCSLALGVFLVLPVPADLTITYSTTVQPASKPEEPPTASPAANNMTIKIKGDKMRINASPKMTTIFDGKTGEVINLMHDQKAVIRISPEKLKAVSDMLERFKSQKGAEVKPALKPTGQKEVVNGYETEEYTYDGPSFKATYWVARNFPDGAAILAQLQSVKSEFWDAANTKMPDFRDFPGLPIRMRMIVASENLAGGRGADASGHPTEIISTITGVSLDSIADNQFTVPADFQETKLPDIFNKNTAPAVSPGR